MTPRKKTTSPSDAASDTSAQESLTFEGALSELESIVGELERDDLELQNALSFFERGIRLMRICDTHLHHARGKISELIKGEDGAFVEKVLGTSLESFLNEEKEDD
jgi:exodeoxyribonuclease VII small subunit